MSILPEGAECPQTWGNLINELRDAGFSADEYLSDQHIDLGLTAEAWAAKPLWSEGTRWIAAYWVVGGSEGYYVHIDELIDNPDRNLRDRIARNHIVGKFWDWERAQECANYAQRLLNW